MSQSIETVGDFIDQGSPSRERVSVMWILLAIVIFGAVATVLPRLTIGAWATMGAVVTHDVPPGATVVGVPARAIG